MKREAAVGHAGGGGGRKWVVAECWLGRLASAASSRCVSLRASVPDPCVAAAAVAAALQFFVNEMTYPAGGQDGKPKRGYQASPEDTYYNLAQYYDIPTISFRCVGQARS